MLLKISFRCHIQESEDIDPRTKLTKRKKNEIPGFCCSQKAPQPQIYPCHSVLHDANKFQTVEYALSYYL